MDVLTPSFFFIFEGARWVGPSPIFLEHWGTPQWKHLIRTSIAQLKQMCSTVLTFSLYIHESWTFSKTIRDKIEVLLGMSRGTNLGTWGTRWAHIGNKGGKTPPSAPTRKKLDPSWLHAEHSFSLAAWNFYFQNCQSPFLA
jgi:hypothetical protein